MDMTQNRQYCTDTISPVSPDCTGAVSQRQASSTVLDLIAATVFKLFVVLFLWRQRHRQRRALAELDDRILQDIGIKKRDALFEANKPFWRA